MDRLIIENILDICLLVFLILISIKDLKEKIIPNIFSLGIIFLGIIKIILGYSDFEKSIIGFGVYPIVFIFIYGYISDILKKEIIGFGDIKLMGALGFYFGYLGIYNLIIFYNLIFILGFLFTLPIIFINKYKKNNEIPFAPFICMGALIYKIMVNI